MRPQVLALPVPHMAESQSDQSELSAGWRMAEFSALLRREDKIPESFLNIQYEMTFVSHFIYDQHGAFTWNLPAGQCIHCLFFFFFFSFLANSQNYLEHVNCSFETRCRLGFLQCRCKACYQSGVHQWSSESLKARQWTWGGFSGIKGKETDITKYVMSHRRQPLCF